MKIYDKVRSGLLANHEALACIIARYLLGRLYHVNQNERVVKTSFGRAQRLGRGQIGSIEFSHIGRLCKPVWLNVSHRGAG